MDGDLVVRDASNFDPSQENFYEVPTGTSAQPALAGSGSPDGYTTDGTTDTVTLRLTTTDGSTREYVDFSFEVRYVTNVTVRFVNESGEFTWTVRILISQGDSSGQYDQVFWLLLVSNKPFST